MSRQRFVIVGGGQAGLSAVAKLREASQDAHITLVCAEPQLPYQRPPLSKAYLTGEMPADRLQLRPESWFAENRIDVVLGIRCSGIDRAAQSVLLEDGRALDYNALLLATGSSARHLPEAVGGGLEGVFVLRDAAHSDAIRPYLKSGNAIAIVGGGYIGLEAAAVAAKAGLSVTLFEAGERILQRVAAAATSDYYRNLHTQHGVTLLEGTGVSQLEEQDGHVSAVTTADGTLFSVDAVLVGIGVVPNTDLAEMAGLELDNGIVVDARCQTSDPHIYAAGDCANFPHGGARLRLESVPHAIHQAETAAQNMLGLPTEYHAAPWFWSDQYDVKLQIAGLNQGYDSTITRAGKRPGAQSIWYYQGDKLLAVDAMNDAPSFMIARKVLESGGSIPQHVVEDAASDLKEYV